MAKLILILFCVLAVIYTAFSGITKMVLYKKGFKVTILNKDFSDLKNLSSLSRVDKKYKWLYILAIIFLILPFIIILFIIIYH